MKVGLATLLLGSVVFPSAVDVQALSDELLAKCQQLGFSEALRCTTCRHIEDIVADPVLTAECLQCCQEAKSPSKKYASATLVYDPRLLSADPELKGFVNDRAADHPSLKLKPSLYAKTVLLMSEEGADERDADTVSIRRWKVDSISDYLREHL